MKTITFWENNLKRVCPCGKEMIQTDETTGGYKCPDKDCWVIYDYEKKEVWVGKPITI